MALRALNSIGGFSVGDNPQYNIILANGDVTSNNITANGFANINGNLTANFANFSGNVNISNANANWGLLTDNLYYSNGSPWDMSNPAGANGYIQYYSNGAFGANANFQFTESTSTLAVIGLANITGNLNVTEYINGNIANFSGNLTALNANLGNLATANYVNIATQLNGNAANFTGNLTVANANLGNLVTANFANFTNNIVVQGNIANANNVSITNDLQGNTANFSGNIVSLNANLGNLATANFVNVASNLNVTNTANVGNLNVTASVTSNLIPSISNTYTLGNATNMWKDLYLSGSSIVIGSQNITSNGTSVAVSNDFGANNFFATNNVSANGNIYANAGGSAGYVYANFANVQSNLYVGANANIVNTLTAANIKDTNLANTQIVFANAANTLTGSANFVFDDSTNTLIITGNANVSSTINGNVANFSGNLTSLNANLGNLATANYVNVTNQINGNIGNFSGNVKFSGAEANIANALYVGTNANIGGNLNVVGNIANANNISVTNNITSNSANFTGLLQGANANFTGNVNAVNFIGNLANGASNVQIDSGGNIRFSPGTGYANAVIFSSGGVDTIGYITANGNITSNTGFVSNTVTAFANTPLTLNAGTAAGSANINVVLVPTGNGTVDVSSKRITSVAEPTQDSDAATKAYVDSVAQGLNIKASVFVATYAALPAYTYNNGTSGVGATITANAFGALVIDGQTISTIGTRVLVKNETAGNAPYNGIYTLTTAGGGAAYFVLTRSLDMNVATEFNSAFTFVSIGTQNADTGWIQTGEIVTVGTTAVVWTQFSSAGQYTANTSAGLILNGTVFSAKVDGNINPTTAFDGNGNIYVPAGAAFTTPNIGAATGTSVDLSGNVLAGNINSNAMITTANLEVSANILTNNITANVNANIVGNLSANNANVTTLLAVGGNANISLTLNGNVANFSGNLTALNANLGNLATANYVNVSNQINGNVANFSGNLTSLNANLGNLATANYVNVANDLNVVGTANLANVSITGNITANNITSNNNIAMQQANIGNTLIKWANATTTSTGANQTIAYYTISSTDIVGVEFLVKSYDSTNPGDTKYSVATVQAVTNGTNADYTVFGTVRLGNTTGVLAVNMSIVGPTANINLQVTPASSNTTVWTTQYRLI